MSKIPDTQLGISQHSYARMVPPSPRLIVGKLSLKLSIQHGEGLCNFRPSYVPVNAILYTILLFSVFLLKDYSFVDRYNFANSSCIGLL